MLARDGSRILGTNRERSAKHFAAKFRTRKPPATEEELTPAQKLYREEKEKAAERRKLRELANGTESAIETAKKLFTADNPSKRT
jgi:hypothetical protein